MLKESKSQLAKLMATENVDVQHQKISTAKFDPKNRVLYLPIWKDMDGALYDLLCGHEVGHALFTPADGWHDAVLDKNKPKNFKNFLNVVEDARIEKKVQRKYPGLRKSFAEAYKGLLKKDFFGLNGRNPNKLPFIDRLNLFTKSQYTLPIDFNEEETKLLEKAKSTESWEEVVKVTNEIYAYSKEEQLEYEDELSFENEYDYDDSEDDQEQSEDKNENTIKPEGGEGDTDDDQGSGNTSGNNEEGEEELEDEMVQTLNRDKESEDYTGDDEFQPSCQTDEVYRQNENSLVDDVCKPRVYLNFPKPNLKNIITPVKRVQELLTKEFERQIGSKYFKKDLGDQLLTEFKKKNDKYISLLAKEFEMKKAAKVFAKRKISSTGDLDINKLASYKFDDNIFRKVMMMPKGKSHGLVLLLDYSGSMFENLPGSIEQVLILASFCRKVNIPFTVYNFGYSGITHATDLGYEKENNISLPESFEKKLGNVWFENVSIREYLNSTMRTSDYNNALKNLLLLKKAWESYKDYSSLYNDRVYVPDFENLTNTPLTQAMYVMGYIVPEFKKQNNLDLVNLVVVHDGDADMTNREVALDDPFSNNKDRPYGKYLDYDSIYVLTDKKNRYSSTYITGGEKSMYQVVCDWFKQTTNSKIVGFYLVPPTTRYVRDAVARQYVSSKTSSYGHTARYLNDDELQIVKQFRKDKLLISKKPGYDDFYLILGGKDLTVQNEEIEVTGKVTSAKLKSAFLKMNKGKQVNRVLVSKFIEKIAA